MRPQLIGVDLDGTLLDGRRSIPPAHRDWVHWCTAQGIRVVIVTGRPLVTAVWPYAELGMSDPLVCFNGVWVGVPGARTICHSPLDENGVRQIIAVLRDYDGMISTYPTADSWTVDRFTPLTEHWPAVYDFPIAVDPELIADWRGESSKVMFVAEPPVIDAVLPALHQRLGADFHVVRSEADRVEIHVLSCTKAFGLQCLADYWDIPQAAVWAAGDADNDLEMIEWAGHGFAMGGASPRLAAAADTHLPSAAEGGLAAIREHIEALPAVG